MRGHLTKRLVDSLGADTKAFLFWDQNLKGFGLKVTPNAKKIYVVQTRHQGILRRFTIGTHGSPWTCELARIEAKRILGLIATGQNPCKQSDETGRIRINDLALDFLRLTAPRKKPHTVQVEKSLISRHIFPLLGKKYVREVSRTDIQKFLNDVARGATSIDQRTGKRGRAIVRGGKGAANRSLDILSAMFSHAITEGIRSDSPTTGIKKFKLIKRERLLTNEEISCLITAIERAGREGTNMLALAVIRLLMLTGCRKSEILTLQWEWIDFERSVLRLPDSKTGRKIVPIGGPALDLLKALPRNPRIPHVFPNRTGSSHFVGLQRIWGNIRALAGQPTLRLHDLRHHFASVGASEGESLFLIGKVLGHKNAQTTQRYAHVHSDPVTRLADRIAKKILATTQAA